MDLVEVRDKMMVQDPEVDLLGSQVKEVGEIGSRRSRKNGVLEVVEEEEEEEETGCLQDVDLLQETEIEEMQGFGDVEVVVKMKDLLLDVMIDHHLEEMI